MISVGIFNGYFPYTMEESIRRIKNLGFSCVQLDVAFKGMDLSPETLTAEKCHVIRDAFREANLPIVAISGYTNLIHTNPEIREKNIAGVRTLLKYARDLGSPYVVSETGTFNEDSDWVYDSRNETEAGYQAIRNVISELADYACSHDAVFLIENYVNNVIGSVDQVLRLFADIKSPGLGLLLDPTNYFTYSNIDTIDEEINRIFNALGDRVKIAHAKDCKRADDYNEKHVSMDADESHTFRGAGAVELPAPGLGKLNYDLYLSRLSRLHPNIPLIIEHLEEDDIARAKAFVDNKLKIVGG